MYRLLTMVQEDEMLILQMENDVSSQIFWVLNTSLQTRNRLNVSTTRCMNWK